MPERLSLGSTLLLVVLAFGLAFAVQAPLSGGSSAAKQHAPELVAGGPRLSLAAAPVPALREPRQSRERVVRARKPARKRKTSVRRKVAPKPAPTPVTSLVRPTPTPSPRFIPPAPKTRAPAPTPAPTPDATPEPTSTPVTSGDFDNSGEP
jgi:outer membrane biosynthesis protein TonB